MAEIKIERWKLEDIHPYEKNAKIHTETQVKSLAGIIQSQGWDVPIVVDKDGVIIKGHGRRLAAIHLGLKEVPVICRRDLTPAQVKAARLSDNRVALTDFDSILIRDELFSLNEEGFDVGLMGFEQKELDMMLKELDAMDVTAFELPEDAFKSEPLKEKDESAPAEKQLEVVKVLGFKTIPEAHERSFIKFQSYAESKTGLKGEYAFAEFCKKIVDEIEART